MFRSLLLACYFLSAVMTAHGTSIIFPTYSTPILVDDRIVVTSPDHMHLLGVTRRGQKIWDVKLPARESVAKHRTGIV